MAQVTLLAISTAIEIGSLAYRLIDRPSPPKPPLETLQVSNAQNGAPVPFGYGTCRFAGQIIWTPGIKYVKTTTGGGSKGSLFGGSGTTNYLYYANFAVAFGEGPCALNRIWGDSKLIYDPNPLATTALDVANYPAWDSTISYSPGADVSYGGWVWTCILLNTGQVPDANGSPYWEQAGDYPFWNSTDNYTPGQVVTFLQGILWVCMNANTNVPPTTSVWSTSNQSGDWVTMGNYYPAPIIYAGDNAQSADPTIQAAEGAANTSAYRALCYAVWNNFPLLNFGNRIPNIRGEVTFLKVQNVL